MFGKKRRKASVDENEFNDDNPYNDSENDSATDDTGDNDNPLDAFEEGDDPEESSKGKRKKKSRRRKSGGRKAGSGIITVLPVVLGILVAVFVIYLGAMAILGPRRGECKQLIARFEEGCQTLNVNEIAYCFKPATRNTILAFTTIGGVVTDSSSEEVLANMLDAIGGGIGQITQGSDMKLSELFRLIRIEPKRYGFPSLKRTVRCKASYGSIDAYINFTIQKKDGEVYISNLEFEKD